MKKSHPEIQTFARVAEWLYHHGWAEANAGNLSIRLKPDQIPETSGSHTDIELDYEFPSLVGEKFLVTSTGGRARDFAIDPKSVMALVAVIDRGKTIRRLWGSGNPTSEFPAHLSIHAMCVDERPEVRAILHTHPPNLVAISHLPELAESGALNEAVRRMHPECFILVPGGIEHIPYKIPGSMDLGGATREALRRRNCALWSKHGIVSIAADLEKALDQVEILEKAAHIYMLTRMTGVKPVGITFEQMKETCKFWRVKD